MTRVNIVVEGHSELGFVGKIIAPACWPRQVYPAARLLGKAGHKGGNVTFPRLKQDVQELLKQETGTYVTTLIDFYGLRGNWPGMPLPTSSSTAGKARVLEQAIFRDIVGAVPARFQPRVRFRPYLQMHEFEALLFSDAAALAKSIECPQLTAQLQRIRSAFGCPEDINDGPTSAPSKRIIAHHPPYAKTKPTSGLMAAESVGLDAMRRECPRFNEWVEWLQNLR